MWPWSLADWDCSLCSCPPRPTIWPFNKLGHSRLLLHSFKSIFWLLAPPSDAVNRLQETTDLTFILLTWRIWWAPNNASKWQMGFNSAFKGLMCTLHLHFIDTRSRDQLKCDGTRAETRFCLSAKRTSSLKSAGASVQSTTGSRGVRISGINAGYTMFRDSVKDTGYPLHSPIFSSLPLPCFTVCHHISTGVYGLRCSYIHTPVLKQTSDYQ